MLALDQISLGQIAPRVVPLGDLGESHGMSAGTARMYQRFFEQEAVLVHDQSHSEMIADALQDLVRNRPWLRDCDGLVVYTKTQTHSTLPDGTWLQDVLDIAGLPHWEALTLSMTNCASALAAVHAFHEDGRPLIVLSGEKAFHRSGNRLAVGLLGEAPVAALFSHNGERSVHGSLVRHLPRFHLNPDDMCPDDRKDLQGAFETEFEAFLVACMDTHPDFFAQNPAIIPYNLNTPLIMRLLKKLGLVDQLIEGHSGATGHTFCSDTLLNLNNLLVSPQTPVLLFCAGMGVTYAAVLLDAAQPHFSHNQP